MDKVKMLTEKYALTCLTSELNAIIRENAYAADYLLPVMTDIKRKISGIEYELSITGYRIELNAGSAEVANFIVFETVYATEDQARAALVNALDKTHPGNWTQDWIDEYVFKGKASPLRNRYIAGRIVPLTDKEPNNE